MMGTNNSSALVKKGFLYYPLFTLIIYCSPMNHWQKK